MNQDYIMVSDLNNYIKSMFEENTTLRKVYIKGEISNFKNHSRGHLYFTLKDDNSRISAVMFFNNTRSLNFSPEDGMDVLVEGRVSCYPVQGTYQIYVERMELDGLGGLYIEYEKLKEKLAKEGLFDKTHKKPIPKFPKKIGIITASTGAAIKDIISTIKRRYKYCETILFPCLVQGKNAAPDIVRQIENANNYDLDVLIIGRGGGSIEDLWAFNEEIVARSIYNSAIPIISAVGHEIDFTIADFVADLRAPTPTGAAEMAVPLALDLLNILSEKKQRLNASIITNIKTKEHKLKELQNNYILRNPLALYEVKMQKLDNLIEKLNREILKKLDTNQNKLNILKENSILKNPLNMYRSYYKDIEIYTDRLNNNIKNIIKEKENTNCLYINKLKLLNPLNILDRGYSITQKNGKVIKSSQDLQKNDKINIKFKTGEINALVEEIK